MHGWSGRSRAAGTSLSIWQRGGWDLKEKARKVTRKAAPGGEIEGVVVVNHDHDVSPCEGCALHDSMRPLTRSFDGV